LVDEYEPGIDEGSKFLKVSTNPGDAGWRKINKKKRRQIKQELTKELLNSNQNGQKHLVKEREMSG